MRKPPHPSGDKEDVVEKYLARRYFSIKQALEASELDNARCAPWAENPADGLTKVRSDAAPLPRLLGSGHLNPWSFRPLRGAAWKEKGGHGEQEN